MSKFEIARSHRRCEKMLRFGVSQISNPQSPLANLDYPFAISDIAIA